MTGNFLKSNNIGQTSRRLLLQNFGMTFDMTFGMTRRGNLERFHRLATNYSLLV